MGRTRCGGVRRRVRGGAGGADQVEQMGPFGVVELQRPGDSVDDALGDSGRIAALELGVVLARNAGQQGNLVATQACDPSALAPVRGQPSLLRADSGPSRGQERLDLDSDAAAGVTGNGVAGVAIVAPGRHAVHPTSDVGASESPCQ